MNSSFEDFMEKTGQQVRPRKMFALKMRGRLFLKGFGMFFSRPGARMRVASGFAVLFLTVSGGVGTYAYTSPAVHVDSALYPVKEGIEGIELAIAREPAERARLHLKMAGRRMDEARHLSERMDAGETRERHEAALQKTMERLEAALEAGVLTDEEEIRATEALEKMEQEMERLESGFEQIRKHERFHADGPLHDRLMHSEELMQRRFERIRSFRPPRLPR